VAKAGASDDRLFGTRWVHVFEEDTAEGAVYRPEEADIPLSRRPRERLELDPDGSATLSVGGPDDRLVEQRATWIDADTAHAGRPDAGAEVRIIARSPDRLVVKITGVKPAR
jgi:hypothetical protein